MILQQSVVMADGQSAVSVLRVFLGLRRQVVADGTTGYGAGDGMVTGDMPGHSADHCTLDATRRQARLAEAEQGDRQDDDRKTFHGQTSA
ncbi:hypothetical protein BGI51_19100 [Pseudomonas oryzihabitans]|jgi:hypothetical protein|nr:hypothetical protein BGI51_19100 [Pseudomonas psychrotolerans]